MAKCRPPDPAFAGISIWRCRLCKEEYLSGPTAARPGSPEKTAVLAARALHGEHLFDPLDSTGCVLKPGRGAHQGPGWERLPPEQGGPTYIRKRRTGRWEARVPQNGRRVRLGLFPTEQEAREAVALWRSRR